MRGSLARACAGLIPVAAAALLLAGCEPFREFYCYDNPNGTFKLGGVTVKCQDLERPARQLLVRINSEPPHRAGNAIEFEAISPGSASSLTVQWDLDNDGEYDDATGRIVQRAYPETPPNARDYEVRARLVDSAGIPRPPGHGVTFRVGGPRRGVPGPKERQRSPFAARTAGAPFSARLSLDVFDDTSRVRRDADGVSATDAYGVGRIRGRVRGRTQSARRLRPFRTSIWITRYSGSLSRSGRLTIRGVAMASFPGLTGVSCIRYQLAGSEDRPGRGTLRVLGGTEEAGALGGSARVAVRLRRDGRLRLSGRFGARSAQGGALPAACEPLRTFSPPE